MTHINTEARKRMQYIDTNDFEFEYHLDVHTGAERHCLKDKNGYIIHFFDTKEQADEQIPLLKTFGRELMRGLQEKVRQHKRNFPQYYEPTYEEANFSHKALIKGFVPFPEYFKPYDNWFGVSACAYQGYTPDAILTRGDKKIILSLQGMAMPMPKEKIEGWDEVAKECNLKYLAFINGEKTEYETYFGQLPSAEFIEQFIAQ